jgi:hypothetical protein
MKQGFRMRYVQLFSRKPLEPDLETHSWPFFHRLVEKWGEFDPRSRVDFRKRNIAALWFWQHDNAEKRYSSAFSRLRLLLMRNRLRRAVDAW